DSYGYRPGRSAIDAVRQARQRCWRYDWVLDIDVKGYFEMPVMANFFGLADLRYRHYRTLQTMVIVGRITLPLGAWAEGCRSRWYDWQSEFSSIATGPMK